MQYLPDLTQYSWKEKMEYIIHLIHRNSLVTYTFNHFCQTKDANNLENATSAF